MSEVVEPVDTAEMEAAARQVEAVAAQGERLTTPFPDDPDQHVVWHGFGAGDPIVLLHGGSGSWNHWLHAVGPLSERYRVLAVDIPGFGDSGTPAEPHSAAGIAAIIRAGIDKLLPSGTRYHIAGFSFGGVISTHIAAQDGERTRSLTLVGAPVLGADGPRPKRPLLPVSRRLPLEEAMARQRNNVEALMIWAPERADMLSLYIHATNARRGRVKSRLISRSGALREGLPQVKARVAGIWGAYDAVGYPRLDDIEGILRAAHSDLVFRTVPNAGHWVAYEAPEGFLEAYGDVLRAVEAE